MEDVRYFPSALAPNGQLARGGVPRWPAAHAMRVNEALRLDFHFDLPILVAPGSLFPFIDSSAFITDPAAFIERHAGKPDDRALLFGSGTNP